MRMDTMGVTRSPGMCKCLCGGDSAHVQGRAESTQVPCRVQATQHGALANGFRVSQTNAAPGPAPGGRQLWRPARRSPHAASTTRAPARQLCMTLGMSGCVCVPGRAPGGLQPWRPACRSSRGAPPFACSAPPTAAARRPRPGPQSPPAAASETHGRRQQCVRRLCMRCARPTTRACRPRTRGQLRPRCRCEHDVHHAPRRNSHAP